MPAEPFDQLLDTAASLHGIDPEFWDIWGRRHVTGAEVKKAILGSLGVGAETTGQLERSLAEHARREWEPLLPPALVVSESAAPEFYLHVPSEALGERARVSVRREAGGIEEFDLNLWELPQTGSLDLDGRTRVRKQARIPFALPLGYHEITVEHAGARSTMRYVVTPNRAFTPPHLGRGGRAAGVSVSLYGIRSARNWGCGDFRDLRDVIDWVASELEASFVALNPLHSIHNRRPFNTSPYLPNSILYQNFLYLDVEAIPDFTHSARAQKLWSSPAVRAEAGALRASEFVEYERVSALKLRMLRLAFIEFLREWRAGGERAREFREFLTREGELLESYATWCALDEHLHRRNPNLWLWTEWPAPYREPGSPETAAFRARHWRTVLFYQYLQWQIDLQLRQAQQHARERMLSIGLYHDLALATDRFGSDLWAHRSFYVEGCRVGSPPDDFSPSGQDWAFPPPASERHRENGYRLFAESIRKNCRHGGALRIDHVMRLFRLYWIPEGLDATEGAYVRERYEDFVRILALESVRNRVVIVGEDLGTVEDSVRETLERFGILSYRLFYFEKNSAGEFRRFEEYPGQALVSSTTHDLPTLAGFWTGADIEARRQAGAIDGAAVREQTGNRAADKQRMLDMLFSLGMLPETLPRTASEIPELTGELHNAIVGFLARTPSQLLAVNQEDLTKELWQQNLPGTTWQYPNWGRKMRYTVEQLRTDPEPRNFTAMMRHWILATGRRNHPEE